MLWKKLYQKRKIGFLLIGCVLLFSISGCGDICQMKGQTVESEVRVQLSSPDEPEKTEKVIDICFELYEKATKENKATDLEMIRDIVKRFGENGYSAVDSKNQIDMTNAEQVITFCEAVDAGNEAKLTIIEAAYWGGFVKYDLETTDGTVNVTRSCYQYQNGAMKKVFTGSYRAENWQYTEDGYLLFSGKYFSEDTYVLTLSDAEEHTAFRVQPLDETCRELNRQYLLPIGYERNNMFLTDWSEEDFGELDFYDLYALFYPKVNIQPVPYIANDNPNIGAVYQIPKDEFEAVIMPYFKIDSETLQSKTVYDTEKATYEYKPRGFYETEYCDYPYPEVVGYMENENQTITLKVHVVFPYGGSSKVYAHEVVVRPLENGKVQYVSNKILLSESDGEQTWYTPRLTEKEWKAFYENTESFVSFLPQADVCLFTETEKESLQDLALQAAEQVQEVYRDIEITQGSAYESNIKNFTAEQRKTVVSLLGKAGYVSVTEDCNMENPQDIEAFYDAYSEKCDAMFTVFDVNRDGLISAITMLYREDKLQTYYIGIGWKEGGVPKLNDTLVSDVAEINLTQKGYFIYTYQAAVAHANSCRYWRTKPLSDECRELTKKYISGLSYVNYNMLVTNWNSGNVEEILMPCMFEDIYRIHTGSNLQLKGDKLPAQLYEEIMTNYFPISKEQLRKCCGYNESIDCYPYEMISASPYAPFGEVVDYTKNSDGTITLIVDGVWPDYNSDCAFTNKIVVQPFLDGTFRYLSNTIEEKELELPPIARSRN